ncbi:MAG: GC-type dockerin domain-anchored protein [Phycisphaerales bacterium]
MAQLQRSVCVVSLLTAVSGAIAVAPEYSNTLGDPGFSGSYVASFAAHDDGTGESLYGIGSFSAVGVANTSSIARWDGLGWAAVGTGLQGGFSNVMASYNGDLIAAGYFDTAGSVPGSAKLARWDGSAWNSMDAQSESFLNSIWDLQVWDDGSTGSQLYIAGNYLDINGQPALDHIAKWDGTAYSPVGGTIGGAVPLIVLDLHVADLGAGERLFAGGRFLTIGGNAAANIASWDGAAWSPLGGGLTRTSGFAQVLHMTSWNDGSGTAIYAGGSFNRAGGTVPVLNVAKWDGSSWTALGDGLDSLVQELVVWDDGSGEALYAIGNFNNSGTTPASRIAKWNGTAWEAVGAGLDANGFGAIVYDLGSGPELHIAGGFSNAGGLSSNRAISLIAEQGCAADFAEPFGTLNFFDISAFITAYNANDLAADFAAPFGVLNFFDISTYINEYNAGCP